MVRALTGVPTNTALFSAYEPPPWTAPPTIPVALASGFITVSVTGASLWKTATAVRLPKFRNLFIDFRFLSFPFTTPAKTALGFTDNKPPQSLRGFTKKNILKHYVD
jgi:hypothetical protein